MAYILKAFELETYRLNRRRQRWTVNDAVGTSILLAKTEVLARQDKLPFSTYEAYGFVLFSSKAANFILSKYLNSQRIWI